MKSPYFPPVFLSFELFLVFVYLPTVPAATFMATSPPRITSLPYIFKARLRHRRHFANFNQATFSNFPSFLKSPATGSAAGYQRPDSDTDSVHGDVDLTLPASVTIIEEHRAQLNAANARLATALK